MKPQEKAVELATKMYYVHGKISNNMAKQCAIIVINEIILFCNSCPILNKGKDTDKIWGFWQEVKSELEKL